MTYIPATYTKANKDDFQVGQEFFMENTMNPIINGGEPAVVTKVTDKAIEMKSRPYGHKKDRFAWFPKSAIEWRDGEKGETARTAKWFTGDRRHEYFFGERE